MPKNCMFAPKGDNLKLFQWYIHFLKMSSVVKTNLFVLMILVPYAKVTTNEIINKFVIKKKKQC